MKAGRSCSAAGERNIYCYCLAFGNEEENAVSIWTFSSGKNDSFDLTGF